MTYSITLGNDDGKFTMNGSTGEITVAGTLDMETTPTYTLTVQADDGTGAATDTATVEITVTDEAACSTGIGVPDPANNAGLVGDCEILLGAMDTLKGSAELDWKANRAMTSWEGVTLGGTPSRVMGLDLRSLGMTGSIPSELGGLTMLQDLDMAQNQLTGSIPTQLGNLCVLRDLNLIYNRLTGSIPAQLGNLSNPTGLWLQDNQLNGGIPTELGSLSSLTWLILSGNGLTGKIPPQLGDLSSLSHLWLQDNQLSGEIPSELSGLSSMQILRLHNNGLTGAMPWQLGNLGRLLILHLYGNALVGCVPHGLRDVSTNDFTTLGLPFCTNVGPVPVPTGLSVTLEEDSFTISWSTVTGAGEYEVQHRKEGASGDWTGMPTTTDTSTTYTPEGGLTCETTYEFRMRAYGDGTTYAGDWSGESAAVPVTTGPCNRPPEFDQESYNFTVVEDAVTSTSVGTVSATDPDVEDTPTYSITLGNDEGKFEIDGGTGEITVVADLDHETAPPTS